jgi:hypothetical protein
METAGQYFSDFWQRFLIDWLFHSPVLLVAVMGLFWSLFRVRRYPKPAKRSLLACLLLMAEGIIFPVLNGWLPGKFMQWQWGTNYGLKAIDGAQAIVLAVVLLLLISAVFANREADETSGGIKPL